MHRPVLPHIAFLLTLGVFSWALVALVAYAGYRVVQALPL